MPLFDKTLMVTETWSWSQIARDIKKCTYRTRNDEYTRLIAKLTKSFHQNMGFFRCFSINFLSELPSILPLWQYTHTTGRNNFSDVVNDVRRSVKGCSVLAILRAFILGAPHFIGLFHFCFFGEGATLLGRPESGFIRHPHQFKSNWDQLHLIHHAS